MAKKAPTGATASRDVTPVPLVPSSVSDEATAAYAARFSDRYAPDFFRTGLTGRMLSSLGIGTYLGECSADDDAAYADAIAAALTAGVNVVDTAINYRCQRSERAAGAAIRRALDAGVSRAAILVCTKGGYLPMAERPPESREEYREYLRREFFASGILTQDDVVSGGHSISPPFLRYAITRSRENLGVDTIDLYYLHNPEQQLGVVSPASLRERLRAAFMVLEDAVTRGEIGAYGCATWNAFRVAPTNKSHLSIQDLVAIAQEVAGDSNHFRAIQMPINLGMPDAFRVATQEMGKKGTLVPALQAAAGLGLSVMASASLMQAQLTHDLPPSMRELFPRQQTDAQRSLAFVRSLPGVTTALVGTRSLQHLAENLASAERESGAPIE
ncbi:MAG TPA: aldo/keto reductase [Gemmatimonadaceae bacterium]|jgi:aryl-alcohol dehydrogenase-like predicted oxidoreductase